MSPHTPATAARATRLGMGAVLSAMAALLAGINLSAAEPAAGVARRPNVLMIVVDDLRPWIGCYGERDGVHTPNLDRLAQRSTLFTRAYCAAPACSPSRASTLTGLAPWATRYYSNKTEFFRDVPALADAVTLPAAFRAAGYETVCSGKVFHAPLGPETDVGRSWERNLSVGFPGAPLGPPAHALPLHGHYTQFLQWGVSPGTLEDCFDWKNAGALAAELAAAHDRPFFYAFGCQKPHMQWYAPQAFHDMQPPLDRIVLPPATATDRDDMPPLAKGFKDPKTLHDVIAKGEDTWRSAIRAYLACVSLADACVGRVLDALDKSPDRDNTIIVLWSDSGQHLGEKRLWDKGGLWEEGNRCCLLIADPRGPARGQRCDRVVSLLDVAPTLYAMAGVARPSPLPGHDLQPLLENPSATWNHPAVTAEGWEQVLGHAVRDERWHYIRYRDGGEELYDLVADPHELTNLASKPDLRAIMDGLGEHVPRVERATVY